jgi:glycopeptide antibiotics resistance protein
MFSSTIHRIQEWGFPSGLRELKWVGYKSWESVILNLLMLAPLGYLVPLCFLRIESKWKVLLTGFGLSLLIETLQLITHRGWFDVDDIFLNTLGAVIGYGLYKVILSKPSSYS